MVLSEAPSPKYQVNAYGGVPPDTVALNATGLPWVTEGNEKSATTGVETTATEWLTVATTPLASATFIATVKTPLDE